MMTWEPHRARELLRAGSGRRDAVFRDGQEEAIRHVVEGHGRLLVVQKTGWGKSFVYFIATKLLREAGLGPALLVSPLLSLMRNQVDAADRMGVRAARVTSDNENDWSGVEAAIDRDEIDILLVSPERFVNRRFLRNILSHVAPKLSLFVVDEAHCISDWGHDFRPDYRHLERVIRQSPASLRVLATTATANQRIMDDLAEVLGPNIRVLKGDLNRPSLALQTMRLPSQAERLAWLAAFLPELAGSGIVYTLTKRDAYRVASWLKSRGVVAEAYTSDVKNREELEAALLSNSVKALVATTSLGMGYDKPDLAFVIHFQAPGSVVAYYQQVGRAGRAISQARGILLCGEEDQRINDYFIQSAFPTRREVDEVLGAFEDHHEGLTTRDFLPKVNLTENRIKNTLNLLSLESPAPVTKQAPNGN